MQERHRLYTEVLADDLRRRRQMVLVSGPSGRAGRSSPVGPPYSTDPLAEVIFATAQVSEESSAINRLDLTALDVIITAIEHDAHFGRFAEMTSHSVFHKFVGRATTLGSQFV
jgi:hypothetical protein